jgi:hypothetical protein
MVIHQPKDARKKIFFENRQSINKMKKAERIAREALIAENAAQEYERSTTNPYFSTRPEELHETLCRIILGAHFKMQGIGKRATQPKMKKIYEDRAIELFVGKASFKIVGKEQLEKRLSPYSWRVSVGTFSTINQPVGMELHKFSMATLFFSKDHHTTVIEVALNDDQHFWVANPADGNFVLDFEKAPIKPRAKNSQNNLCRMDNPSGSFFVLLSKKINKK